MSVGKSCSGCNNALLSQFYQFLARLAKCSRPYNHGANRDGCDCGKNSADKAAGLSENKLCNIR